ncbi:MAG TPA: PAS domain-containing protein [Spirochaetales bacterium]|nr:PAS domain-containing protein [Spirochaetales bacterium]HRY55066.1 PAS domain-containing protein [Spirochaetia bacterium]HRZ64219.1 PAS domain-containing protein [Spirochaetia bacterium]
MNPLLRNYIPLVDFLAEVLGERAEVVLHDLGDVEKSVVAIRNGHISGRRVGSPATNMVLKTLVHGSGGAKEYLANYKGLAADGRALRSSTMFLRDDAGGLIGILCVNIDTSELERFRDCLDRLIGTQRAPAEGEAIERLSSSVEELALDSIEAVVAAAGVSPSRMSQEEKIEIVRKLNDDGVFLLKGAIPRIAAKLGVSEPTAYRYLNCVKKGGGGIAEQAPGRPRTKEESLEIPD